MQQELFTDMGVGTQPAKKLADKFDNEEGLVEFMVEGRDLTEIDGVGDRSSSTVYRWFKDEYPEKERKRREKDDAHCLTFTEGVEDDSTDEFVWAWICPRCGEENPCKGNPTNFAGRPYTCLNCLWVPLLDAEAIQEFRESVSL